jgi:methylenetetrahydrofolate reductase (NADPH)
MTTTIAENTDAAVSMKNILRDYSVELTARDRKSLEIAPQVLQPGQEVFIAALPNDKVDDVVAACAQLRRDGLTPVPHVVARNIESVKDLDSLLGRLVDEAGMERCLVLGGDRDKPAGALNSSFQILETGLIQKHGVKTIRIGAYPEGHPKISNAVLDQARAEKLALAERDGLDVTIVSQFTFDSAPIIAFTKHMRSQGVKAPFRVGVAGPANRGLLIKYALICGVGNSLKMLQKRADLAMNTLSGETPEAVIRDLAAAQAADPSLGISGIHFFTFGSLAKSAEFAKDFI